MPTWPIMDLIWGWVDQRGHVIHTAVILWVTASEFTQDRANYGLMLDALRTEIGWQGLSPVWGDGDGGMLYSFSCLS